MEIINAQTARELLHNRKLEYQQELIDLKPKILEAFNKAIEEAINKRSYCIFSGEIIEKLKETLEDYELLNAIPNYLYIKELAENNGYKYTHANNKSYIGKVRPTFTGSDIISWKV